jgi:DNA-binding CsgD family transcriptional regulator
MVTGMENSTTDMASRWGVKRGKMSNVATSIVWHGAPHARTLHRQDEFERSFYSAVTIASPHSRVDQSVIARERPSQGSLSEAYVESELDQSTISGHGSDALLASEADTRLGKGENKQGGPWSLTQRELEVLQLLAEGTTNSEISARLFISPKTTKNHLAAIFQKLDVTNRTQALVRAVVMGLVSIE